MSESRDEYARPTGPHRAQAPKPAQAGPSLPRADIAAALATVEAACQDLDNFTEAADGPTMRAYRVVAQALALGQSDREGDWATLADRLNSCLREASLPEVPPRVERIKDGMMALLYELNRTKVALGAHAAPHTTTLTQSPTTHGYWWTCTCGDEGGPYEHYSPAWDATVDHERGH